jgi:hypothetical protein
LFGAFGSAADPPSTNRMAVPGRPAQETLPGARARGGAAFLLPAPPRRIDGVGAPGLLPDACAVREDRRRAAGAIRAPAAGTPLLLAASAHDDLAEQAVILVADAGGEQQ